MAIYVKSLALLIFGSGASYMLFIHGIPSEDQKLETLRDGPVKYVERTEFFDAMKRAAIAREQNSIFQQTQKKVQVDSSETENGPIALAK